MLFNNKTMVIINALTLIFHIPRFACMNCVYFSDDFGCFLFMLVGKRPIFILYYLYISNKVCNGVKDYLKRSPGHRSHT